MKKLPCYLIAQNIINISEHHTSRPRKKSRTQEKQNPPLCRIRIMARNSRKGAGRLADGCKNDFYQREIYGEKSTKFIYYISSLPMDAQKIAHIVREHWGIENTLHWGLDVMFHKDCRFVRKDNFPKNLATMRRNAFALAMRLFPMRRYQKS